MCVFKLSLRSSVLNLNQLFKESISDSISVLKFTNNLIWEKTDYKHLAIKVVNQFI